MSLNHQKSYCLFLNEEIKKSKYPVRSGNHIEDRGSMLNFSIVGRDCSLDERLDYFEYDVKTQSNKSDTD